MTGSEPLGEARSKGNEELEFPLLLLLAVAFLREVAGEMGGDLVGMRGDSVGTFFASVETLLLINLLMSLSTKLSELLVVLGTALGLSGALSCCWAVMVGVPEDGADVPGVPGLTGIAVTVGVPGEEGSFLVRKSSLSTIVPLRLLPLTWVLLLLFPLLLPLDVEVAPLMLLLVVLLWPPLALPLPLPEFLSSL